MCCLYSYFFFFQAEDGIRDLTVTGVQTCALPISGSTAPGGRTRRRRGPPKTRGARRATRPARRCRDGRRAPRPATPPRREIGRASCRERGEISVVAVSLKKKKKNKMGRETDDSNH